MAKKKSKNALLSFKSRNELIGAINKGQITEAQIKKEYIDLRKQAIRQIKRIESSNVPFYGGDKPYPRAVSKLVTTADLIGEVTDVLRFMHSKRYSITDRRKTKAKIISTLQKHGISVDESNFDKWIQFIQWFKLSAYSALYDSSSDITEEVFQEGANSQDWERLFKEYIGGK